MKHTVKTILVLLIAALALVAFCLPAGALNSSRRYLRGDATGDGVVNISDVTAVQRHIAQLEALSSPDLKAAQVQSKPLSITDATCIQRYLASFPNDFNIGQWVNTNELPFIPD